jgi:polyribonucleotide nucleotidyltransferase
MIVGTLVFFYNSDRSLRPMFPPWFDYETQIICNLMAVDGEHDPDILSINAG